MASDTDYTARFKSILGKHLKGDTVHLKFEANTSAEAKLVLAEVRQMQQQLRLLKKDVGLHQKEVRSTYTAAKAETTKPTFGKGVLGGIFGKKAVGQSNAREREKLRQKEHDAMASHEKVKRAIDETIMLLDKFKLQVEREALKLK